MFFVTKNQGPIYHVLENPKEKKEKKPDLVSVKREDSSGLSSPTSSSILPSRGATCQMRAALPPKEANPLHPQDTPHSSTPCHSLPRSSCYQLYPHTK